VYFIEQSNPQENFRKNANIKFQENPSSGSRVILADGWTNGQTDTKKLIVGFRNFASEPEKLIVSPVISVNLSSVFYLYINLS